MEMVNAPVLQIREYGLLGLGRAVADAKIREDVVSKNLVCAALSLNSRNSLSKLLLKRFLESHTLSSLDTHSLSASFETLSRLQAWNALHPLLPSLSKRRLSFSFFFSGARSLLTHSVWHETQRDTITATDWCEHGYDARKSCRYSSSSAC